MLMWVGILPAALVLWIMRYVKESPVWLERRGSMSHRVAARRVSFAHLFRSDLLPITLHTTFLLASLLFLYNSITWWYPTLLDQWHLAAAALHHGFSTGGIAGAFICGRLSETGLGRRGVGGAHDGSSASWRCRCICSPSGTATAARSARR